MSKAQAEAKRLSALTREAGLRARLHEVEHAARHDALSRAAVLRAADLFGIPAPNGVTVPVLTAIVGRTPRTWQRWASGDQPVDLAAVRLLEWIITGGDTE